ncbi:MAG: hypothetical protein AB4372_19615 [Xenococcus sp. (in: cyanobacteria)]
MIYRALSNFELIRDVYGSTNEETALAAAQLRNAGYQNIAELMDGLAA